MQKNKMLEELQKVLPPSKNKDVQRIFFWIFFGSSPTMAPYPNKNKNKPKNKSRIVKAKDRPLRTCEVVALVLPGTMRNIAITADSFHVCIW